jgi:hypothetical protein
MKESMYYQKVIINSEDDLPKEEGVYFVHYKKYGEGATHIYLTNLARKHTWLTEIDWYLQPIEIKFPSEDELAIELIARTAKTGGRNSRGYNIYRNAFIDCYNWIKQNNK